jgi:2-amino-4-hydroxy-6-hydroxymethyldihydropteridine diphosphokinase
VSPADDARRRCWVSIGSNVDRERSIRGGVADLRERFGALILSRVYETPAVGFTGEPFLNLVAGFDCDWSVAEIDARLRAIEDAHGRVRGPDKFAPRTLDLDLLTWGDAAGVIDGVALPRDEILKYGFVLGPLAEAAPDERHPENGRRYADLWAELSPSMEPLRPYPMRLEGVRTGPQAHASQRK